MQKKLKESNVAPRGMQLFENPNQLLTVKQAAAALSVSIYRVYKWVGSGELKARRLPGTKSSLRIVASDLEALLRPAYPNAGQVPNF